MVLVGEGSNVDIAVGVMVGGSGVAVSVEVGGALVAVLSGVVVYVEVGISVRDTVGATALTSATKDASVGLIATPVGTACGLQPAASARKNRAR
jgi:hypothetical protein